ncbi:carboxylating nicotinate-nucleotide diphosphorylase, partial [Gammaproteobacteria bacterium]|nr:carboxylating nicotinate-nucleotide diphosphorylase [Gammaproteobacteria bacterium]
MIDSIDIPKHIINKIIENALAEDLGSLGDITSKSLSNKKTNIEASINSNQDGVISGLDIIELVFKNIDANTNVTNYLSDCDEVKNGTEIARVIGDSHSILAAERVALNFLGHMSGIASETNKYVKSIANTKARILSTRKTTPGLRAIEKYAVRCGGGYNHRYGLDYGILIKDNHIKAAGGIEKALKIIKINKPYMTDIEVEVDTIEQFLECQLLDVRYILLDNMSPQNISECIKNNKNGAILEASGGINLDSIADIAQTGV